MRAALAKNRKAFSLSPRRGRANGRPPAPMGGTCISRRFHIGYVNSRRMCVVGLDWQPTTPTRRRELSHTPACYVISPIPEGTFVISYENAPCAPVPRACPLSFFVPAGRSRVVSPAAFRCTNAFVPRFAEHLSAADS